MYYNKMTGTFQDREDLEDFYEDYLSEIYGTLWVGPHAFGAGQVLRLLDPAAFIEGLLDYVDSSEDIVPVDDLKQEIDDLADSLYVIEAPENGTAWEWGHLKDEVEANIEKLEEIREALGG